MMNQKQMDMTLNDFFGTETRERKKKGPFTPSDIIPSTDIIKEIDDSKPTYTPMLNCERSFYGKTTENFRETQRILTKEKVEKKRSLYVDHRLDPFYLVEHIESITYEIVPFVSENQREFPIEVDQKTGYLTNPRKLMQYILEDPLHRSLCFVHLDHDTIHVMGKERDANTRILYCRVFHTSEEFGWVWVSKVIGVPYGWVFLDAEKSEEDIVAYLSRAIPIRMEPLI